eukprot:TRINITY_DN8808_c0_g2_i4.p1 TRINITY_DN8808_c0_g2~~TRINITY_DN8808_c0_g2_i4.p1  ORF type:complete len:883 (-),score=116.27 TRINITY_DN8808_c0_g2_i4:416-3064(-)
MKLAAWMIACVAGWVVFAILGMLRTTFELSDEDRIATPRSNVCVFTISRFAEYGSVKVFFNNVERTNPNITCIVWVVADNTAPWGAAKASFDHISSEFPKRWHLVTLDHMQKQMDFSYKELAFRYDKTCLGRAVKPIAFKHIFHELSATKVMYFDSDIWIMQPLTYIVTALDRYSLVVTPHMTKPLPIDGRKPDERIINAAGQFDFCFVAMARGAISSEMLSWLAERLRYYGLGKTGQEMFLDQSWGTYVTSYFPQSSYLILRDPRYNVGYKNLHYRGAHLRLVENRVLYDSTPVVFMHLAGTLNPKYDIEGISESQNRYTLSDFPNVRPIFETFMDTLVRSHAFQWHHVPYGFDSFSDGTRVHSLIREYYIDMLDPLENDNVASRYFKQRAAYADPFMTEATDSKVPLLTWMLQGMHHGIVLAEGSSWLPEIAWRVFRKRRAELSKHFPKAFGQDLARLRKWFFEKGIQEERLNELETRLRQEAKAHESKGNVELARGVNVVAWLHKVFGVGEAGRLVLKALQKADVPAAGILIPGLAEKKSLPDRMHNITKSAPFYFNIVVANAPETHFITDLYLQSEWKTHYNIGFWLWEQELLPEKHVKNMDIYHEIWAGSEYARSAFVNSRGYDHRKPVITMQQPFFIELSEYKADRNRFNFPQHAKVFLVMFDFLSVFERKNPIAAVKAFRTAFGKLDDASKVLLVVKCLVPSNSAFKEDYSKLREAAKGGMNIRFMTEVLSEQGIKSLMASVDVIVSLHRAEGTGLHLLEMMMLGKPVIATNYSGNLDFMSWLPPEFQFMLIKWKYIRISELNISKYQRDVYDVQQRWAEPDEDAAADAMQRIVDDYGLADRYANVVGPYVREKFGVQAGLKMAQRLGSLYNAKR